MDKDQEKSVEKKVTPVEDNLTEGNPTAAAKEEINKEDTSKVPDTDEVEEAAAEVKETIEEKVSEDPAEEKNTAETLSNQAGDSELESKQTSSKEEDTKETTTNESVADEAISNKKVPQNVEAGEQSQEEDEHHVDYSNFTKRQLITSLQEISNKDILIKTDHTVQEIKSHYDEYYQAEKAAAKKSFLDDGGDPDEFQYRHSEEDREFFKLINDLKTKRTQLIKELERSKDQNLEAKNQILQKLRDIVDSEETTLSINTIKDIQSEWKKIGPVPAAQNKNLWASYNALMDRFYDNRSIYFELKELDRKKNLEHKLEICQKAEALDKIPDLKDAIKILNDLHEEFKHVGPVPQDEQEKIWTRFKSASDAVYAKRKSYFDDQAEVFTENLGKKEVLITKLEEFQNFKADRIKDWNVKTKEILAIQKDWEAIGPVPREKGKEINKAFWGHFKQFFHHKNQFFKELDELRLVNKEKAEALIEKAISYSESTDWQKAANELIQLQQEWKDIGPTPEKVRDDLYKRFKSACDTFFENRRQANKEVNKEFDINLAAKRDICTKIKNEAEQSDTSVEKLEAFIEEFNSIGFVPRKNIKEIAAMFKEAVDTYANKMGVEGKNKEEFLFRLNLTKLQGDPNGDRVLNKKEHGIRKQISDLENNITLWKNNLEFFASSKTADKLKDQFDEKIEKAEEEIDKLKKKLSIIREF